MALLTGAKTVALERQWRVPDHGACFQPGVPATELLVARTSFFEYIEALFYRGENQSYNSSGAHWYIRKRKSHKKTFKSSKADPLLSNQRHHVFPPTLYPHVKRFIEPYP